MRYTAICPMCGTSNTLEVNREEAEMIARYGSGRQLIQDALPQFNAGEREFIKTGYCGECQELLFGNKLLKKSPRYNKEV